uniref:TraX family protein n=1 Tax=Lysinibacillus sp. FSL H8-0500 TaxID=2921393 RepID=UPI004047E745
MLKIIAMLSMLIDHVGVIFFPNEMTYSIVGRLAFPLFCWGIAEGFIRTSHFYKYLTRLIVIAIISQIPYNYLFNNIYLNVCFTLALGLLAIKIYSCQLHYSLKTLIIIVLLLIADGFHFEYGIYGVLSVLFLHIFKSRIYLLFLCQTLNTIFSIYLYSYQSIQIISIFALFLIIGLKKFDFKINPIINYSFYPLHITILYYLLIFNTN